MIVQASEKFDKWKEENKIAKIHAGPEVLRQITSGIRKALKYVHSHIILTFCSCSTASQNDIFQLKTAAPKPTVRHEEWLKTEVHLNKWEDIKMEEETINKMRAILDVRYKKLKQKKEELDKLETSLTPLLSTFKDMKVEDLTMFLELLKKRESEKNTETPVQ